MSTTETTTPQPPRRTTANQENAQHSTGPRTDEGKARSRQNATHRVFSPTLVQTGEDPELFDSFHNSLLRDLCPKNNHQAALAERIIAIHWRLRRLQSADNCLNQTLNCQLRPSQTRPPGYFIAASLLNNEPSAPRITPFERLLNAETKLQSLLSKAMRDYRQTQREDHQRENDPNQDSFCLYVPDHSQEFQAVIQAAEAVAAARSSDPKPKSATPPHTAPQSATISPEISKNEPTCQNDTQAPEPLESEPNTIKTHQPNDPQRRTGNADPEDQT